MEDNDPEQLCKQLTQSFLSKIRNGVDRAALVTFIAKAFVSCELNSDLDEVNKAVDNLPRSLKLDLALERHCTYFQIKTTHILLIRNI